MVIIDDLVVADDSPCGINDYVSNTINASYLFLIVSHWGHRIHSKEVRRVRSCYDTKTSLAISRHEYKHNDNSLANTALAGM